MAWQSEMVRIVRHLINDLDSTNYSFTDDRLEELILVASQLVLTTLDFTNEYTVDVDALTLNPDPTTGTKDDSFINLVSLKAACVVLGSEVRSNALNSISLRDGPSAIDLRGITSSLADLHKMMCEKFETAVLQYRAGSSVAGKSIVSPFANQSRGTGISSYYHGREGYFGG